MNNSVTLNMVTFLLGKPPTPDDRNEREQFVLQSSGAVKGGPVSGAGNVCVVDGIVTMTCETLVELLGNYGRCAELRGFASEAMHGNVGCIPAIEIKGGTA